MPDRPRPDRARLAAELLRAHRLIVELLGDLLADAPGSEPSKVTAPAVKSDEDAGPSKLARKILAVLTDEEVPRKAVFARAKVRKDSHAYSALRELLALELAEIGPSGGVRLKRGQK